MVDKRGKNGRRRGRAGVITVLIGFLLFILGAYPDLLILDRSPIVGFVQIAVFLMGLAIICVGGYLSLSSYWLLKERSIIADIGLRLVATGYVIAVTSGMADVFGFGTQPWPQIPFFGPMQEVGVLLGESVIAIGFALIITERL